MEGECAIHYEAEIALSILTYYLPFVLIFAMSIVLIVTTCKQRGKRFDNPFVKESLYSCCACTIMYTVLNSPEIFLKVFGILLYVFGSLLRFCILCIPGMMCQMWLLVSKEIRTSAFCKSPKTGEKAELIPKE